MVGVSRYSVGGDEEDVSRNKLGITDPNVLEDAETVLLRDAYDHFLERLRSGKLKFSLDLLFEIHDYFLGPLYTWAGKARTVNISKNNAIFVPAQHIQSALKQMENDFKKSVPKPGDSLQELARKLAFIHCELNVIHPFREGNGRTVRLFLDLLAVYAGYEAVDFTKVSDADYFDACRRGMIQDYGPMESLYRKLLQKA